MQALILYVGIWMSTYIEVVIGSSKHGTTCTHLNRPLEETRVASPLPLPLQNTGGRETSAF